MEYKFTRKKEDNGYENGITISNWQKVQMLNNIVKEIDKGADINEIRNMAMGFIYGIIAINNMSFYSQIEQKQGK